MGWGGAARWGGAAAGVGGGGLGRAVRPEAGLLAIVVSPRLFRIRLGGSNRFAAEEDAACLSGMSRNGSGTNRNQSQHKPNPGPAQAGTRAGVSRNPGRPKAETRAGPSRNQGPA
ncbi:hypothetical protein GCM10009828_064900 [Actinoplanes couchii]|uniref:Uncharacterized protein n=1 Tax=Actinoplanes couchii TaxID=403638 RepID=A0ABQ3X311_9ACTN|nr:hypothetical protein Aco03nite_012900 [Actinoplanes couchii]